MHWKLYRKDDPNTWPEIDCPMLVYDEVWCDFYICKWNNNIKKFIEPERKIMHYWKECYYQYIGYVPNGYKICETRRCSAYPNKLCEYVDDGYCFDAPEDMSCKFCKKVNEYSLNDNKRIWKEFE